MRLNKLSGIFVLWFSVNAFLSTDVGAQVSVPVVGGSQKASVCQWLGPVEVCVTYSSPGVTTRSGKSRRGEIWGGLVPYGMSQERWLEDDGEPTIPKPWRAGANENTVLRVSHDVLIEGEKLRAGEYGLFFIPGQEQWEMILSNDSQNWGHYSYDEKNDALRVKVTPGKSEYHEWLTYAFSDRKQDRATLVLSWEDIGVPVRITVPESHRVYIEQIRTELQSRKMLYWYNWHEAAKYCLDNNVELDLGLHWIEKAINQTWVGSANFVTLKTKADILHALNRKEEGDSVMQFAVKYAGGAFDLHNYGRELLRKNRVEEAMEIFRTNAARHPDLWLAKVGLARAYGVQGNFKTALKHAYTARRTIPKEEAKVKHVALAVLIEQLEKKQVPAVYLADGLEQGY